jgi:16S rRNA (cytosine967-C5)-methyltransferase
LAQITDTGPTRTRTLALELLLRVEREGAYADRLFSSKSLEALSVRDRAFVRELVLGVLRWKLRLDRIINGYYQRKDKPMTIEVRTVLRLGLLQLLFMDSVPDWAAVSESVSMARTIKDGRSSGLVNAILRRTTREGEPPLGTEDPAERLSVLYSHPRWLVVKWLRIFGPETTESILGAGNSKHPITVRVNTLRTNAVSLRDRLGAEGITTEPVDLAPGYLMVADAHGLFDTDSFREGLFTVQDPATELAVALLDPHPGERILDLCAAPGGKATAIAELSDDKAQVTALDLNAARLGLVTQAAERLGIGSIAFVEGDATSYTAGERYDRVLCDVPCTGTAVFSKRPDMKWRRTPEDSTRMAEVQKSILKNAYDLAKPGGIIVYSTCSLEPEEDEDVIAWFLAQFPADLERDERFLRFETPAGYRIFPHQMVGTGAFASRLRKRT